MIIMDHEDPMLIIDFQDLILPKVIIEHVHVGQAHHHQYYQHQ
jgi:hypothetical protein